MERNRSTSLRSLFAHLEISLIAFAKAILLNSLVITYTARETRRTPRGSCMRHARASTTRHQRESEVVGSGFSAEIFIRSNSIDMSLMKGKRAITKAQFKKAYDTESRVARKGLNRKQKKQVIRVLRKQQEMKYAWITGSTAFGASGAGTGPLFAQLTQIPQGDTDLTRDGDRYHLIRHRFRAMLFPGGQNYCQYRVILFQWFPASTPVLASILITGGSGAIDTTSEYNHDNRQHYKILYDRMLPGGLLEGGGAQRPLLQVHNYDGKHADCQMINGSTTDGSNQIYLIAISDINAATYPSIKFTFKVFFTDA